VRNRLIGVTVLVAAACAQFREQSSEARSMSTAVVGGIQITLTGPESLPQSAVRPASPTYNPTRGTFTVVLKNETSARKVLPFDEISRNIALVYRNPSTRAELVDNHPPPPKRNGAVEAFAAGASRSFDVIFTYPESIATMKDHIAVLSFCIKWESNWLRAEYYRPKSYDWNESFEVCRQIRVLDE
jgi:hypothetical protein